VRTVLLKQWHFTQIPFKWPISQYSTAVDGTEHAAGLLNPLRANRRGGDPQLGSRGRTRGGGGRKARIRAFAEFGSNYQFLTETAVGTTASCTCVSLNCLIGVKFWFEKGPLVYLGWYQPPFRLRTGSSRRIPQVNFWLISPPAKSPEGWLPPILDGRGALGGELLLFEGTFSKRKCREVYATMTLISLPWR